MKHPLYERAYDAAQWHWRAAGILIRHSREIQDDTVMWSYAVLASFSIELYLKAIFYIEAKEPTPRLKGHSLTALFEKLRQGSREAVRQYFEALVPRYVPAPSSLPESAMAFIEANAFTTDFDTTLRMMSDAFINFRYWYQKESNLMYPSAAEVFRHALNRRIVDLVPELKSH